MRIELRDAERRRIGRLEVDPAQRPTRVSVDGQDHFLDWDTALDDAGHLRRCIACGCPDLFRTKAFPQITGLVVVLAFTGVIISALGLVTPPMLIAMVIVLIADVAIFLFSRQQLVCHRCRTSYHELAIARYHRPWDRAVAERHVPPRPAPRRAAASGRRRLWPRRSGAPAAGQHAT
jgi:hypothetical protein